MITSPLYLTLALFAPLAADETKPTFDKPLVIKDVQGGFAGFTGKQWRIEPSGEWAEYEVFNEKLTEKKKGKVTKEQLAALARTLDKFGLADLPNEGKEGTNPKVLTITYGKREAILVLDAGAELPKPNQDKPKDSVANRYSGIVDAALKLVKEK